MIPPLPELIELHERASLPARRARVVALALNTAHLDEEGARRSIADAASETGLPATTRSASVPLGFSTRCSPPLGSDDLYREAQSPLRPALRVHRRACSGSGSREATPRFGVAEDATKYAEDGDASFYLRLRSLRMVENRIAVRWNPAEPTEILEQKFLDRAVPLATQLDIRLVFDVFSIDPFAFGAATETRAAPPTSRSSRGRTPR